jgi:hypothetical protein
MKKYRFRNWVRNWLNKVDEGSLMIKDIPQSLTSPGDQLQSDGMRFVLHRANGGYVIETTKVDRVKDRVHHQMYIITGDADIGNELGKIITMESLR